MIAMDTVAIMNEPARARSPFSARFGIAAILCLVALSVTAGSGESANLDGFAKCLGEKKVLMYGSFLCPHCDEQRKSFGSSFQYVPYVECSIRGSRQMTFPCIAAQIHYTPTWIFDDGSRLLGVQSLKTLSDKTGCKLP